jgi:hypothetical protein
MQALDLGIPGDQSELDLPEADDIRINDRGPVMRAAGNAIELVPMTFSFPRGRPGGAPVFNFRSEGRHFADSNRCLIPASAFFEFTGKKYPKAKHRFALKGSPITAIAGLWRETQGNQAPTFTMLTTAPGPDVAPYHNRQVVVLRPQDWSLLGFTLRKTRSNSCDLSQRARSTLRRSVRQMTELTQLTALQSSCRSGRLILQAHSIELSPNSNAVAGGIIEGKIKFRGQIIVIGQQQPYAGRREVQYPACDEGALVERDHARLEATVPRGDPPFNACVHRTKSAVSAAASIYGCQLASATTASPNRPTSLGFGEPRRRRICRASFFEFAKGSERTFGKYRVATEVQVTDKALLSASRRDSAA